MLLFDDAAAALLHLDLPLLSVHRLPPLPLAGDGQVDGLVQDRAVEARGDTLQFNPRRPCLAAGSTTFSGEVQWLVQFWRIDCISHILYLHGLERLDWRLTDPIQHRLIRQSILG